MNYHSKFLRLCNIP